MVVRWQAGLQHQFFKNSQTDCQKKPNINKKKLNCFFCVNVFKKKRLSLLISVQNLYFCPKFKVKTNDKLVNNENSNMYVHKLKIIKKIY